MSSAPKASPSGTPPAKEITPVQQPDEKLSVSKLEEGVQDIARVLRNGIEIRIKSEPAREVRKADIIFLVIGVVDLVMLFWLIPSGFWQDKRIEFLKELIPWIVGGLSAFLATLYRDIVLEVAQNKWFRISGVIVVAVLAVVWAPLFSFRPVIEPNDAQLTVDTEEKPRDLKEPLRVNLREHTYLLKRAESGTVNTRSFTMGKWDLLTAAWGHNTQRWSLLYELPIQSNRKGAAVIIERTGSPFDRDFLRPDFLAPHQLTELSDHKVQFQIGAEDEGGWLNLPAGRYDLSPTTPNCVIKPNPLEVPLDRGTLSKAKKKADEFAVEVACN